MRMKNNSNSRRLSRLAALSVIIVLELAACAPAAAPTPAPTTAPATAPTTVPAPTNTIQGVIWQWVSVTNQTTKETTTVPNPESYTIIFNADSTLTGKADCNNFSGTYSQQNGFKITLGPSTMAFCGETSLDRQYLQLLGSVAAGGPDGAGGLALETAGGEQRMMFQNGGAAPIDPAIYNQVPKTTTFAAGQCQVVLSAPAPAYTSNTIGGVPSGAAVVVASFAGAALVSRWPVADAHPALVAVPMLVFLAAAPVSDLLRHRRPHPVTLWGGVAYLVSIPVRFAVAATAAWHHLARWLVR